MELNHHSTFNPNVIRDEIQMITGEIAQSTSNNQGQEETQVIE